MKNLSLFLLLTLAACKAQAPTPQPIPGAKHEEISRVMLVMYAARLNFIQSAGQGVGPKEIITAQQNSQEAEARWQTLLAELQKKYHAEGCAISVDKKWVDCPNPK